MAHMVDMVDTARMVDRAIRADTLSTRKTITVMTVMDLVAAIKVVAKAGAKDVGRNRADMTFMRSMRNPIIRGLVEAGRRRIRTARTRRRLGRTIR